MSHMVFCLFDPFGTDINATIMKNISVVSTCNIVAEHVVAGYGLISLPSTVKAILS